MKLRQSLRFYFRGERIVLDRFDPSMTLLEWLREAMRATGTKEGCNEGDCGACTVVLARLHDGALTYAPVNSCILLLGQVDGAEIITIEDLARDGLHPVQSAMVTHHGSQCGFCTPGIVMSLFAAYHNTPRPVTRAMIEDQLAGNLCRCTGYRPIVDAAMEALAGEADDIFTASSADRRSRLEELADDADLHVSRSCDGAEEFFTAPASIDSLAALALANPDARLLAGATDVGLWVTKRLAAMPRIIWLGRVAGLDRIEETESEIHIGAMATHAALEPVLDRLDPDLGLLMRRFGSKQVRASGTIGGNIANGSPIGDLAPALIALGARLHLRCGDATRTIPLEAFFIEYGRQDRAPGEFVLGISLQRPAGNQQFRCFKISKRFDEDISAVMGAFRFSIEANRITEARIAFGGMAGTPSRASATEQAMCGVSLADPHAWAEAMTRLAEDFAPISDMRASAGYRGRVARAILGKALLEIAGAPAETRILARTMRQEADDAA